MTAVPALTNVRRATPNDIPRLLELYHELDEAHRAHHPELFAGAPTRDVQSIVAKLHEERAAVLVADVAADDGGGDSIVAGFVRIVDVTTPHGEVLLSRRFGLVDELAVATPYRRLGIASALLKAAETWAKGRKVGALEVTVWAFNDGARELYAQHDYAPARYYLRKPL